MGTDHNTSAYYTLSCPASSVVRDAIDTLCTSWSYGQQNMTSAINRRKVDTVCGHAILAEV